jgi:hypothetical protein
VGRGALLRCFLTMRPHLADPNSRSVSTRCQLPAVRSAMYHLPSSTGLLSAARACAPKVFLWSSGGNRRVSCSITMSISLQKAWLTKYSTPPLSPAVVDRFESQSHSGFPSVASRLRLT